MRWNIYHDTSDVDKTAYIAHCYSLDKLQAVWQEASDAPPPASQRFAEAQTSRREACRGFLFFFLLGWRGGLVWSDGWALKAGGSFTRLRWHAGDLCVDEGQLVSTGFQTGGWHAIWTWCFPDLLSPRERTHILLLLRTTESGWVRSRSVKSAGKCIRVIGQLMVVCGRWFPGLALFHMLT